MKGKQQIISGTIAAIGMFFLIIDTKTAIAGAEAGVQLCLRTVIPSLFPFFVLSNVLMGMLSGGYFSRGFRWLGNFCGIPDGQESHLIVGLLGGYPVGAQNVAQAYRDGALPRQAAQRLLGFCSNAGPSFIFGIGSVLFPSGYMVWLLWGVHILSAIFVGRMLPGRHSYGAKKTPAPAPVTWVDGMHRALRSMAAVCGWVILFRVILAFLDRWFLWLIPDGTAVALSGFLELTNGCIQLNHIDNIGLRFCLCAAFLGFGGVCVAMQTVSVTKSLGAGMYFPGKTAQASLSFLIAYILQMLLFPADMRFQAGMLPVCILFGCGVIALFLMKSKKTSSNLRRVRV